MTDYISPTPAVFKPEILAPAGDSASFLAAIAAGADAVYLGLKHFSARMAADNFGMTELSRMVDLANQHQRKVYVAFNTLIKPDDLISAGNLISRMARDAKPHALIVQDPGIMEIARQAGYTGELHLSTLANLTHSEAMKVAVKLGAKRALLPRELSIDEVRQTADLCPQDLDLEYFIHGALCYCVSGRCYWSSYMGGKSGLRGRCVQPCRRVYQQKSREGRYFSCQDLSLDVLVKTLMSVPRVKSWKIEGRKKGPHYVYHVVTAYKMLRDEGNDPKARKDSEDLLEMALGRPRTHARFLPQRVQIVTTPDEPTSSGMLVGKIQFSDADDKGRRMAFIKPRLPLIPKDLLRVGYEDEAWHATIRVSNRVPKSAVHNLRLEPRKTPKAGTPVFLIDRKENDLEVILRHWQGKLNSCRATESKPVDFTLTLPPAVRSRKQSDITVRPSLPQGKETRGARKDGNMGLWMSPNTLRNLSRTIVPKISWWLPPVIWPDEEQSWISLVREALRQGANHFVCNAPWQVALFGGMEAPSSTEQEILAEGSKPFRSRKPAPLPQDLNLVAGPFCNISNAASVAVMAKLGFKACFVSPELSGEETLTLPRQSCLPLGLVLTGYWPAGIARHGLNHLKPNEPFTSPKKEVFWARNYGQNLWIYPGWPLDLSSKRPEMEKAGYSFFAHLNENVPQSLPEVRRASTFNWDVELL